MQRPSPFPFHPPGKVTTLGSAALQCLAKPDLVVDLALTIPKACLYDKDHLDCKYHGKRALWLAAVAAQLKKHAMFKQQEWTLLNNDARQAPLSSMHFAFLVHVGNADMQACAASAVK